MLKQIASLPLALALLIVSASAHAQSVFDPLVAAVSFTDAQTAIFAVAAVLVGLTVVLAGIVIVWKMVKKSKGA
jgi:hypothetical protein